ncbi:hypothetical protein VTK73DRAFT_3489 [Phialemonium thermophilum]|uniref:Thioredoxin reductase n=1 Tax=Phialemonium thermophilum TaxID=223376 RepID=A0ABR3WYT3_9PEZI
MPEIGEDLVGSIAQAINSAKVPCVLWGHYLLNLHGVPSIIGSIDFVVPDKDLPASAKSLAPFKTLKACNDVGSCPTSSPNRYTPPPAFHKHLEQDPEVTVDLHLQSKTLWFLPPLNDSVLYPAKASLPSHYVLASDRSVLPPWRPGRGYGFFRSDRNVVVVPRSHVMLEAFIRLHARDSGKRIGSFSLSMIAYIQQYVDDDGLLDIGQLPGPLKASYIELREGKKPVRQWTKELREALGVVVEDSDDDCS